LDSRTREKRLSWAVAVLLFSCCLALYVSRMAPSVVPGDPGEYQLIAARWGIGHPPGYGFYALLGNVFTHLVPVGTFAWRANLLSAVCGALIVSLAYGIGQNLCARSAGSLASLRGQAPSILGALCLAAGIDLWQHAIHANAHIVTSLLAAFSLFCLVCWWRLVQAKDGQADRWLFAFCVVAGVSPVQHPLLVFGFPAYAVFILCVRPRILGDWRTLLRMFGFALLGLSAYLYYPIRSALGPPPAPGPSAMHTWAGFASVVTAQGLRVNLFQFSPIEIAQRLWDARVPLNLQYPIPVLLLAGLGCVALWWRQWRPALLLTAYLSSVVLVTVNILQDEMAYLLGPVIVVAAWVGCGVDAVVSLFQDRIGWRQAALWVSLVVAAAPIWSTANNWARMDLSDFLDADEWLAQVETQFVDQDQQVTLLTEWERMTTVYYYAAVEGRMREEGGTWVWDSAGVRFVPVFAGVEKPFLGQVEAYLPRGPVYLTMYRPQVAETYRLMPRGHFWQVLPGWPRELPAEARPVEVVAGDRFEIVGWNISQEQAVPGDVLAIDLFMRMPDPEGIEAQQYYLPWARLGDTTYHFTTDSRFHTPWWQPGEIVGERFLLPVPWQDGPGSYPLRVGVWHGGEAMALQGGQDLAVLSEIEIEPARWVPTQRTLDRSLGSVNGEILLRGARVDGHRVAAETRLTLRPGRALRVVLDWESLRPIEENYTVFVQLLDAGFQVRAQDDITPLGGSAPTLLWFPRWRRGTRIVDTHVLQIPADLAPGEYPLVVGMYGFSTHKRAQIVSSTGDMEGDWITLAHLQVE
jgi:hypothetical protein